MNGLLDIYERIASKHRVDTGRVALAGISAGALVVMEAAFEGRFRVSGFIGLCPDVKPEKFYSALVSKASRKGIKGVMIYGGKDPRLDDQRKTSQLLAESGYRHSLMVIPGLGHWYLENMGDVIDSGLREIFGSKFGSGDES